MPAYVQAAQAASPDKMTQQFHSNQNLRAAGIGSFRSSISSAQHITKQVKSDDPVNNWDGEQGETEIASIINDPYDMAYDEIQPVRQHSQTQFAAERRASDDAWRRMCYLFSCLSCVVIIGLSIGLGRANKQVDASPILITLTRKPSESPTAVPTTSPRDFKWCYGKNKTNDETASDHDYERYDSIESALINLGVSTEEEFSDNASYQKKALCWLSYGDRLEADSRDPFLAQRYVLAAIYYSFGEPLVLYEEGWLSGQPECNWEKVSCDKSGTTTTGLELQGLDAGTLPKEMSVLKYIYSIDLSGNSLNEDISEVVGSWVHLEKLVLSGNRFENAIPESLALSTQLTYLDLSTNFFNGTIPSEFGSMTSLEAFYVHNNDLTGTMPEALCELRKGNLNHLTADCEPYSDEGDVTCLVPSCCTECKNYDQVGS